MRVLFITRKYPPQVGGMEQFSHGLFNNFSGEKKLIALTKSQKNLWWWLPVAFIKSIFLSRDVDLIHLGDALLAPLGRILKIITKKPVVLTAHGLDITWPNENYQKFVIPSLKKLNKIICVSQNTVRECEKKGIDKNKLIYIPNGVDVNRFKVDNFEKNSQTNIITVGRLVKRKGVNWFVRKVMPRLEGVQYLIIGSGSEKEKIEKSIKEYNLDNKVKLLGRISDEELKQIYNQADLFVMPNIIIKGDREGFGIVALEAASIGLPVIASGIEGIKDAIINGKNGFLVSSGNAESFINKINELLNSDLALTRTQIKEYTAENYSWQKVCQKYLEEFERILK